MPLGAAGGTGGGGILLGPTQNTFNGATKSAAATARDTYFTANATKLAQYDANPNLAIRLTWPVTPTNVEFQVRAASAWVDATGVVEGPKGDAGDAATATPLSDSTPQDPGTASAGSSTEASRSDHTHAPPDDEDILDAIQSSRSAADRGKALAVSDTDEDGLQLKSFPAGGGGSSPTSANTPGVGEAVDYEVVTAAKTLEYGKVYNVTAQLTVTLPAAAAGDAGKSLWVRNGGASGDEVTVALPSGARLDKASANWVMKEGAKTARFRCLGANTWTQEASVMPQPPTTAGNYVLTVGSSGELSLTAASGGAALTDDAILDVVKDPRTSGDRGMAIGTSASDENVLAFLSVTGGASVRFRGAHDATETYALGDIIYTGTTATVFYLCVDPITTATPTEPVDALRRDSGGNWLVLPGELRSHVVNDYYPAGSLVLQGSNVYIAIVDVDTSTEAALVPGGLNAGATWHQIDVSASSLPALPTSEGTYVLRLASGQGVWVATVVVARSDTAPASPSEGDLWVDTTGSTAVVKVWEEGDWRRVGATRFVPLLPTAAQADRDVLYVDENTGEAVIYGVSGGTAASITTTAFTHTNFLGAQASDPSGPSDNQSFFDTDLAGAISGEHFTGILRYWDAGQSAWRYAGLQYARTSLGWGANAGWIQRADDGTIHFRSAQETIAGGFASDTEVIEAIASPDSGYDSTKSYYYYDRTSGGIKRLTGYTAATGGTAALIPVAGLVIKDEGTVQGDRADGLNFVGAGVTVSGSGREKTVTITGSGGGTGIAGITIQDEGSALATLATTLDFRGPGVEATGNTASKTITIKGVYVQDSAPASPSEGDLWVDTTGSTSILKVRGGSRWMSVPDLTIADSAPTSGIYEGSLWVDTTGSTTILKVYDGSAWDTVGGSGGTTLTDDAVLDLAKTTRTSADRRRALMTGTGSNGENELNLLDPLAPLAGDSDDRFFEWSAETPDQLGPSLWANLDGLMGATTDSSGAPTLANAISSWSALTAGTRTFWFGKRDEGANLEVAKDFTSAMAAALVRLSNIGTGDQSTNAVTLTNVSAATERTDRGRSYWTITATVTLVGTLSGTGGPIAAHDTTPTKVPVKVPRSAVEGLGPLLRRQLATDLEVLAAESDDVAPTVRQAGKFNQNLSRYRAGSDVPNPGAYNRSPPRKPILDLVQASADTGSMFDTSNQQRGVRLADTAVDSGRAIQLVSPAADPLNATLKVSLRTDAPGSGSNTDSRWGYIFGFATQTYSASNVAQDTRALSRGGFAEFIWMGDSNTIRFDPKKLTSPGSNTNFSATEVEWAAVPAGTLSGRSGITGAAVGGTDAGGNALTNAQLSVTFASSGNDAINWGASDTNDEFGFIVQWNDIEGGFDHYMGRRGHEILVGRLRFRTAAADPFSIYTSGGNAGNFENAPGPNYFFKSHPRNPGDLDAYLTEFVLDSTANRVELVPGAVKTDILAPDAVIPSKVAISNRANSRLVGISAAGVFEAVQHGDVQGIDINRDVTVALPRLEDTDFFAVADDGTVNKPTQRLTGGQLFDYVIRSINAHRTPETAHTFYKWLADDTTLSAKGGMRVVRTWNQALGRVFAATAATFNATAKTADHQQIVTAAIASGLTDTAQHGGVTYTQVTAKTSGTGVIGVTGTPGSSIGAGVYRLTATTGGDTDASRWTLRLPDGTETTGQTVAQLAADANFGYTVTVTTDVAVNDVFTVTVTAGSTQTAAAEGDLFRYNGSHWEYQRNIATSLGVTGARITWQASSLPAVVNDDFAVATASLTGLTAREKDGTTAKATANPGDVFKGVSGNWVFQFNVWSLTPVYESQPSSSTYEVVGLVIQNPGYATASDTAADEAPPNFAVGNVFYLHPDEPYKAGYLKCTVEEVIVDGSGSGLLNLVDGRTADLVRVFVEPATGRPTPTQSGWWRLAAEQPDDHLALVPGDVRNPGDFATHRLSSSVDANAGVEILVRDGPSIATMTLGRLRQVVGGRITIRNVALSSVLDTAAKSSGTTMGNTWDIEDGSDYSSGPGNLSDQVRIPTTVPDRRRLGFFVYAEVGVGNVAGKHTETWIPMELPDQQRSTDLAFSDSNSGIRLLFHNLSGAGNSETAVMRLISNGQTLPANSRVRIEEVYVTGV